MKKIIIKTPEEINVMKDGGEKLTRVKSAVKKAVKPGVGADEIEKLANGLIEKEGGRASFMMVPKYSWATCVNVNEGVVHGIPKKEIVFKKGDIVSVDVGLFYRNFHTDTSFTVGVDVENGKRDFLQVGNKALNKAIQKAKPGNKIYDISLAIEKELKSAGLAPIRALVGHGVGKDLHEEPQIPCFVSGKRSDSPDINPGMVLAIEVMYTMGKGDVYLESDGWTISTKDGKIAALFEETVAVTKNGNIVLTR